MTWKCLLAMTPIGIPIPKKAYGDKRMSNNKRIFDYEEKRVRMIRTESVILIIVLTTFCLLCQASADPIVTIYELQYTTDPNGVGPYEDNEVDCYGGIVVHKYPGWNMKITLYDPNHPDGWGGIAVKDFDNGNLFDNVNVGDRISLTNTMVEEFRGNTQLRFESQSAFTIESSGNALPEPIPISPNDIASPVYQAEPEGWFVADHTAEKYEGMWVRVENVKVIERDLGKAYDNYVLQDYDNDDPNQSCWSSDYMNESKIDDYHPFVELGRRFCSVSGIVEQYVGYKNEYDWDYYQLLTTRTGDLKRHTPADINGDCMVDSTDLALFCQDWLWGTE